MYSELFLDSKLLLLKIDSQNNFLDITGNNQK